MKEKTRITEKINEIKNKQQKKINKIQSWFYEKVNRIDKPSARVTNKREN